MALKITTQISTDRGTTSEAYVRITSYTVSKFGHAQFELQTFLSQADAVPVSGTVARNYEIGDVLDVILKEEDGMTPDLSALENVSIFEYGYGQLRAKLEGIYGATNVVNC